MVVSINKGVACYDIVIQIRILDSSRWLKFCQDFHTCTIEWREESPRVEEGLNLNDYHSNKAKENGSSRESAKYIVREQILSSTPLRLACERRLISEPNDSRKYVCVRRLSWDLSRLKFDKSFQMFDWGEFQRKAKWGRVNLCQNGTEWSVADWKICTRQDRNGLG